MMQKNMYKLKQISFSCRTKQLFNKNCKCLHCLWTKWSKWNFTLKNCLLGATNIVNNSNKEKYIYGGYAIAFDGKGEWLCK